jgi:hypothetical protein
MILLSFIYKNPLIINYINLIYKLLYNNISRIFNILYKDKE